MTQIYEWMNAADKAVLEHLDRHLEQLGNMAREEGRYPGTQETLPVLRDILNDIREAGIWTCA